MTDDDPPFDWKFRARPKEAVDGDTYDFVVDLGFGVSNTQRFRHAEFDTAEIFGVDQESEEFERGWEQKKAVLEFFRHTIGEWPLIITTEAETGKYGRYLVTEVRRKSDDEVLRDAIPGV